VILDCLVYRDGAGPRPVGGIEEARAAIADDENGFAWILLREPQPGELETLGDEFGLPALAIEDAVNARQRPKLERYGDDIAFLVMRTAEWRAEECELLHGEVMVFAGRRFVVTVVHGHVGEAGEPDKLAERAETLPGNGVASALYAVTDAVVDGYEEVIDQMTPTLEELESEIFNDVREPDLTERIYTFKRHALELNRVIDPVVEPLSSLKRGMHDLVPDEVTEYFRDVADHAARAAAVSRDAVTLTDGALSANLTEVSLRQNEDMRKISAWAAVIAVPTLLAGIWGMNFEHMPELSWPIGYPLALVAMVVVAGALLWRFKRSGWL
jgi:magnesium transporter